MAKAVNMGTFRGSNGKLNPDQAITREEAFVVLASAFKLTGADLIVLSKFSDTNTISTWAKPATAALVAAGYASTSGGKVNPKANITWAELAQIMDNLIKGYFRVAGTYTSVPDGNIMINSPNVILKGVTVKGDLIIGDGVGNGDVTLDSVKVTGRTVVRGGGVNSIKIIGASDAGMVVVARVDGQVRVAVSDDAKVQVVVVDDGSDGVIVEGKIGTVDVRANGITVTANNAQIGTVNVAAEGAKIAVGAGTTVETVKLDAPKAAADIAGTVKSVEVSKAAENATVTSTSTAKIDIVKTEAAGTTVTGTGKVLKVEANANNVKVDTPNTLVSAGAGTTGVIAGGKTVEATTSTTTFGLGHSHHARVVSVTGVSLSAADHSDSVTLTATVANAKASDTATVKFDALAANYEFSGVPIVDGQIAKTFYGLYMGTYNVTVSVGTASASAATPVSVNSPFTTSVLTHTFLASDFGNGKTGLEFGLWDAGNSLTGSVSEYVYNYTATNLASGVSQILITNETGDPENVYFDNQYFQWLHSYDPDPYFIPLVCNPDDVFTEGDYAITLQVYSTEVGNPLIGETSFEISIAPGLPD